MVQAAHLAVSRAVLQGLRPRIVLGVADGELPLWGGLLAVRFHRIWLLCLCSMTSKGSDMAGQDCCKRACWSLIAPLHSHCSSCGGARAVGHGGYLKSCGFGRLLR